MLVNVKDKKDNPQQLKQDLQKMSQDLKDKKNVDLVTPPQLSKDKDYALIAVIPEKDLMQNLQIISFMTYVIIMILLKRL